MQHPTTAPALNRLDPTASPLWQALIRLLQDRRGVSILEVALLGPIIVLLFFAFIDAIWTMMVGVSMSNGAAALPWRLL